MGFRFDLSRYRFVWWLASVSRSFDCREYAGLVQYVWQINQPIQNLTQLAGQLQVLSRL